MINRYNKNEIETLIKNLCVIVDSREKANSHIIDYYKKNKINYRVEKLEQGDYSICVLSNEETTPLGINRDLYFSDEIVIERKASIDEVAGNMKDPERTRLKKEFSYLKSKNTIIKFYIENPNFFEDIRTHNYRSQYNPKALYESIKSFESEFNFTVIPIAKTFIGAEMFGILKSYVKNKFIKG